MDDKIQAVKENTLAVQAGLKSIGTNRAVALSAHVTREVIAEMEERIAKIIDQLDQM